MTQSSGNSAPLDIAIIGAGPGGLSAAHALANRGFSVGIFDRAQILQPIGAALGLAEQGYEALNNISLSLSKQVRSKAVNPRQQLLMRPSGEVLFADESPMAGTSFTWLGWFNLQSCLYDALPSSVQCNLNHSLTAFMTDRPDTPICLKFRDQADQWARILVGADGYRSIVRDKTVGDGPPLYTGTMTWRGIVHREHLGPLAEPFTDGAGFQLVVGDQKNFWMMDAGADQIAWGGTAPQASSETSESAFKTALLVFKDWPAIVQTMIQTTDPLSIIETGVFDRKPVSQWGDGQRVTLLGDAAHPIRPSLGLGTTLALQDAVTLAEMLDGVQLTDLASVSAALTRYEQKRIEITTPLQQKASEQGLASHADDQADRLKMGFEAALASRRK